MPRTRRALIGGLIVIVLGALAAWASGRPQLPQSVRTTLEIQGNIALTAGLGAVLWALGKVSGNGKRNGNGEEK